ncbi:MAG: chorismate--pyruvate lyase family protein [Candidatus Competibacteraceae bacterium]
MIEFAALPTDSPVSLHTLPRWHLHPPVWQRDWPAELSDWLFDAGSLTRRLRQCCSGQLRVQVLSQGWIRPDQDEARALQLRLDAWAWTREVQLRCDKQPWVFARTVIPACTLRGRGRRLTWLGTRPLGEALFTDPGVQRGPVEVARIVAGQRLHQRAVAGCAEPLETLWGRRSVFRLDRRPLLVCEVFLPDLPVNLAGFRSRTDFNSNTDPNHS